MSPTLTDDIKDDILLAGRYGDLDDVQAFVREHGASVLTSIRDENGNCILHMICANGHLELLEYLLPLSPPSLLATQNESGSTPLHWAALNSQLDVARKLVEYLEGPGRDLIDIKNKAGRSPLGEAELAGWDDGAKWFVEMMNLELGGSKEQLSDKNDTEDVSSRDIEVEIEDADGQIAKMMISGAESTSTSSKASTS